MITFTVIITGKSESLLAQESYFHLTVDNGLASTVVHDLLIDSDGYLWVATEAGVNRYDGKNLRRYTTSEGLGGNEILNMALDSKGRIWFLSFNGNVSFFKNNQFYNAKNTPWLDKMTQNSAMTAFYEEQNGDIWIATEFGHLYQVADTTVTQHLLNRSPVGNIRQIWKKGDNFYFGLFVGVYTWRPGLDNWTKINDIEFWSHRTFQKPDGTILIPTRNGLASDKVLPELLYTNEELGLNAFIQAASIGPSGRYLALGTIGDGIRFYDISDPDNPKLDTHWLKNSTISDLIFDNEGSLWISTLNQGVYRIDSGFREYKYFNESNILNDPVIRSSFITSDGTIWFGGKDGSIYRFSKDGELMFRGKLERKIALSSSIETFAEHEKGKLLIGSTGGVVQIDYYDKDKLHQWHNTDFYDELTYLNRVTVNYSVKSIASNGNDIFLGTNRQLVKVENQDSLEAITFNRITDLEFDRTGKLWIGTLNGLYSYYEGISTPVNHELFDHTQIVDIERLYGPWVGISTYGSGLVLMCTETGTIRQISSKDGIISNLVKSAYFDSDNYLWIGTNDGINKFKLDTTRILSDQLPPESIISYTLTDGLNIDQIGRIKVTDGRVWVSGNRGITTFRSDFVGYEPQKIPIVLEDIQINGVSEYTRNSVYEIGYGRNQVDINFTGIFLRDGNRVRYKYRIKEFDQEWTFNETGELSFRYLDAGLYTLEIIAFSNDGRLESDPLEVRLSVTPPLWQQPWFLIFALLATTALIYAYIRWRIKEALDEQKVKQEVSMKVIELEHQALMAMMKPHTIFNQISALRLHLFNGDPEKASEHFVKFTKLLRMQLDSSFKKINSLQDEMDRIRLQLDLDSEKLDQGIQFEFICEANVDPKSCMVPSLILQPFIENTVIHGLMNKRDHGFILIWALERDGQLVITIDDNGAGLPERNRYEVSYKTPIHLIHENIPTKRVDTFTTNSPSIGLQLFIDRIRLIAGENTLPWSVTFQNKLDNGGVITGVRVELLLPIMLVHEPLNQ
jgi:ligand-binding sensor domain-containing protein